METEKILDIKPSSFKPKPKVDSTLICLIPKSEFNKEINDNLLKGVERCITENSNLSIKTNVINVPGSFEIPYICNRLVNGKKKILLKTKLTKKMMVILIRFLELKEENRY